jgi:broad specificity phosphatase PhoE
MKTIRCYHRYTTGASSAIHSVRTVCRTIIMMSEIMMLLLVPILSLVVVVGFLHRSDGGTPSLRCFPSFVFVSAKDPTTNNPSNQLSSSPRRLTTLSAFRMQQIVSSSTMPSNLLPKNNVDAWRSSKKNQHRRSLNRRKNTQWHFHTPRPKEPNQKDPIIMAFSFLYNVLWNTENKSSTKESWNTNSKNNQTDTAKMITFIRHGCTYMNEYLGGADHGKSFGAPYFTDVFDDHDPIRYEMYRDTKLSPYGIKQVNKVLRSNQSTNSPLISTLRQCDLILVSPLTRAIQTYELGIKPHIDQIYNNNNRNDNKNSKNRPTVLAIPQAAERLYLISDVGRPVSILQKEYPYIDFSLCTSSISAAAFALTKQGESTVHEKNDKSDNDDDNMIWWYQPEKDTKPYVEWRPMQDHQTYACPGEPMEYFNSRMTQLYYNLQNRSERHIVLICHHGVIDWFLARDFMNCQYRTIPFHRIQPKYLQQQQQLQPIIATTTTK